jgi:hypothetical protein
MVIQIDLLDNINLRHDLKKKKNNFYRVCMMTKLLLVFPKNGGVILGAI